MTRECRTGKLRARASKLFLGSDEELHRRRRFPSSHRCSESGAVEERVFAQRELLLQAKIKIKIKIKIKMNHNSDRVSRTKVTTR
jgi:hypothetical protein